MIKLHCILNTLIKNYSVAVGREWMAAEAGPILPMVVPSTAITTALNPSPPPISSSSPGRVCSLTTAVVREWMTESVA